MADALTIWFWNFRLRLIRIIAGEKTVLVNVTFCGGSLNLSGRTAFLHNVVFESEAVDIAMEGPLTQELTHD